MKTALFVTVGTSLLHQANISETDIKSMQLEPLEKSSVRFQSYRNQLAIPFSPKGKSCAEVATISALATEKRLPSSECVVYLFPSETLPSLLCALAIGDHLRSQHFTVEVVRSTGFHLNDPDSFGRKGMAALMKNISERLVATPFFLLKPHYLHERNYLVVSGGYKGALIYLTLFSQIVGVDLVYQFEKDLDYKGNPPLLIIPKGPFALALPFAFKLYAQANRGTPTFSTVEAVINEAIGANLKTDMTGTATEYLLARAMEKELNETSPGSDVFGGETFKDTVFHGDSIDLSDNSTGTDIDILLSRQAEDGKRTAIVISVKGHSVFLNTEFKLPDGTEKRLDKNLFKRVSKADNTLSLQKTELTENMTREKVKQLAGTGQYEFWYFLYQYQNEGNLHTKQAITQESCDTIQRFNDNCQTMRSLLPAYRDVDFRLFFVQMNPGLLTDVAHDESSFFKLMGSHTLRDCQRHLATDPLPSTETFFFELASSPHQEH